MADEIKNTEVVEEVKPAEEVKPTEIGEKIEKKVEVPEVKTFTEEDINIIKGEIENSFKSKIEELTNSFAQREKEIVEKYVNEEQKKILKADEDAKREREKREAEKAEKKKREEEIRQKELDLAAKERAFTVMEVADELDVPKHLRKYISGSNKDEIAENAKSLILDMTKTKDEFEKRVMEAVEQKFATGATGFQKATNSGEMSLDEFRKLTTLEKFNLMETNPTLFEKMRALQLAQ